jgi:hypothetical protein
MKNIITFALLVAMVFVMGCGGVKHEELPKQQTIEQACIHLGCTQEALQLCNKMMKNTTWKGAPVIWVAGYVNNQNETKTLTCIISGMSFRTQFNMNQNEIDELLNKSPQVANTTVNTTANETQTFSVGAVWGVWYDYYEEWGYFQAYPTQDSAFGNLTQHKLLIVSNAVSGELFEKRIINATADYVCKYNLVGNTIHIGLPNSCSFFEMRDTCMMADNCMKVN